MAAKITKLFPFYESFYLHIDIKLRFKNDLANTGLPDIQSI